MRTASLFTVLRRASARRGTVLIATLSMASFGCSGDAPTGPGTKLLEAISPTSLTGEVGAAVSQPPAVVVRSRNGSPRSGVPVRFQAFGGSIDVSEVLTDASGHATVGTWILGTAAAEYRLHATAEGNTVTFIARAQPGPPAVLARLEPERRPVALPGDVVPLVTVRVADGFGNPVRGAIVTFSASSGGRLDLSPSATVHTDVRGLATSPEWQLGSEPGEQVLTIATAALDPLHVSALALDPSELRWYKLVLIRAGTVERSPLDPIYSIHSRLGLTPVDPCLCQTERGQFVERGHIEASWGTVPFAVSGVFRVDRNEWGLPRLYFDDVFGPGAYTWQRAGGGSWFDGTRLVVERLDWDMGFPELWIYEPDDGN